MNFDDMTPDEQHQFRLEFELMYLTTRFRVLEEVVSRFFQELGLQPHGETFDELFRNRTDAALKDLLRRMADDHPDQASDVSRFFDELKKRGVR